MNCVVKNNINLKDFYYSYTRKSDSEENVSLNENKILKKNKSMIFFYPNYYDPISVFELEDLSEETFCVLYIKKDDLPIFYYKWRGNQSNVSEEVNNK